MDKTRAALLTALLGMAGPALGQSYLMVPDSSSDVVNLFDPFDGSLVQTGFIDVGILDITSSTPKDAIQVGSEIWVSDQLRDTVYRFDLTGAHSSSIVGGMDNIRGMAYADGTVYVSNSGSNNGAPGEAIVTYLADGTSTGFFSVTDPFDVLDVGDGIFINDIDNDKIDRYMYDGTFVSNFVDSDGETAFDFPQQMNLNGAGNILVAGFSTPSGIYEYAPDGTLVNYYDVGGIRGVYELGNGNLMFTNSDGVNILDPNTGAVSLVYDGSSQYINLVVIPAPAGAGLIGLASLGLLRRRR
jgi:hypothetical protein